MWQIERSEIRRESASATSMGIQIIPLFACCRSPIEEDCCHPRPSWRDCLRCIRGLLSVRPRFEQRDRGSHVARRNGGRGGCRGERFFAPTAFRFGGACRLRDRGCFAPTYDSMKVIWHDDEGLQFSQREMARDILPTTLGDFARVIQPHFSIHDFAEQAFPSPRADRHEIRAGLGIVMSLQADGVAMVSLRVVSHHRSLASRHDSSRPAEDLGRLRSAAALPYPFPLSALFRPLLRLGAGRACVTFLAAERSAR